jgi:RHS repeat-associated protein
MKALTQKLQNLKPWFLLAGLILQATFTKAGIEPTLKKVKTGSSIHADSILEIKDYYSVNDELDLFKLYRATNRLRLEINHDKTTICLNNNFTFRVRCQITKKDFDGTTAIDTVTLRVNYDTESGEIITDASTFQFEDSYETTVVITEVLNPEYADFVKLTLEMEIERYREIDLENGPTLGLITFDTATRDLVIVWSPILGAEEYDLEWTYVDAITENAGDDPLESIPVDFTDNATRVTIKQNNYRISNIFDQGVVVFRVRAVTKSGSHFTHRIEGPWSNKGYTPRIEEGLEYTDNYDYYSITSTKVHEESLNWQLIATFAEEGLKKEVVTYMDGLFRARQTVTRNNTDTMAIVGDFFYDHQNRQTIAVLPVPAFDKKIRYHKNFNRVSGKDTVLRPKDYLKDISDCLLPNPKLDSLSGAGRYYSSKNPLISNSSNTFYGNNQYIPHAFGFPYTKTEYYPDPTNRVRRQGGVGPVYQIGAGHETQYIYSTAYKEEIDPLFGNDVGYAGHYQKQMVVDPNGQVSISYTNLAGKTIATALAGDNTSSTTALNSLATEPTSFNLLSPNDSIYSENALSTWQEFPVEKEGTYYFDYKVTAGRFENGCTRNLCYDCIYDLTINVRSECGEELLDGDNVTAGTQPLVVHIGKKLSELEINCEDGSIGFDFNYKPDSIPDSIAVFLPVGKYSIEKNLVISLKAAQMYADSMVKYDTCRKSVEDFTLDILGDIDMWGCELDCEKCATELGSLRKFMGKEKFRLYKDSTFTVTLYDSAYYKTIYNTRKEICSTMCTKVSPCEGIYNMLIMDVSENGQYPGIAVTSHPEYCHYLNCLAQDSGKLYDAAMMEVESYTEAESLGFLNPLEDIMVPYTDGNPDPYFNASGLSSKNEMSTYLSNVPNYNTSLSGYTAWELALLTVKGNHLTDGGDISDFISSNSMGQDDCNDLNNLMWQTFRGIYLSKKNLLYQTKQAPCYEVSLETGKRRLFPKFQEIADSLKDTYSSAENARDNRKIESCDSNCWYQVDNWLDELVDCDFGGDTVLRDSIVNALVKVCKYGCNDNSPYGSSSVDPKYYGYAKYKSFGDVLVKNGIYVKELCDSNLLEFPLPFNQGNQFLQNDTNCCACDFDTCTNRIKNKIYQKAAKAYINSIKDTTCKECKDCAEIGKGVQEFNKVYPTIQVMGSIHFRELFENFMNTHFRFNLSYSEYLDFMEECLDVTDSLFNDSIIYHKYLETYYPYPMVKPDGFSFVPGLELKKKNNFLYQPNTQYASILAEAMGKVDPPRLNKCYCNYVLNEIGVQFPFGKTLFTDSDIDQVMGGVDCEFSSPRDVFKACLGAAKMDTAFTTNPYSSAPSWNATQQGYLDDQVTYDISTENDFLVVTSSGCDCPDADLPPPNTLLYDTILRMKPFDNQLCDTTIKWVDKYLNRVSPENRNNRLQNMQGSDIAEQFRFAKYLDSCFLKKGINRGINYGSFNRNDSNALSYYIVQVLANYYKCKYGELPPPPKFKIDPTLPCTTCYEQGKMANLLLNYLRQMSGNYQGVQNYISVKSLRLVPNLIKSYYETDLYSGTYPARLRNTAVGVYNTHYRKFNISDGSTHNVTLELAFIENSGRYNFGNILSFYDLQVLRNGCSNKSQSFVVQVIVKGKYPKLDTTTMFGTITGINLLESCQSHGKLCNRAINDIKFTPDSCAKIYRSIAEGYARELYDRYTDSVKKNFISKYVATCRYKAKQTEMFKVNFNRSVYHYTLYYYDQVGNLIQTVPPKGVNPLTGGDINDVELARKNSSETPVYPSHSYITRYKYNSLNQLVWQSTPDAGESKFWYDRLGRLVASQNAQQLSTTSGQPTKRYSYTLYDSLGRIKEVGELTNTTDMTNSLAYDYDGFVSWVGDGGRTQITRTYYDRMKFNSEDIGLGQENLRSRVASITIQQSEEEETYDEAVHYSYDIHGNVKSMVRENRQLTPFNHHLKKLDYQYDLISGKVNTVIYQRDQVDQFIHKYVYDAENRILAATTSTDNVHYETDARYYYYKHGPLARTEIGRLYVQGVDYIYTLQGWLKGVNTTSLNQQRDPGRDGYSSGANQYVSRDEYSFSLRYYQGDFVPINLAISSSNYFDLSQNSTSFGSASPNLFNGNISNMVTSLRKLENPTLGRAFKYDQLNRIKEALSFTAPDIEDNEWGASQASDSSWYESFDYDANGNITKLKRKGNNSSHFMMDNLGYNYQSGTNKLIYVNDDVTSGDYENDFDDQGSENFKYDNIGNLTGDVFEGIDTIEWTVYGKIKSIVRTETAFEIGEKANLAFTYTPDGHRSTKSVSKNGSESEYTYYVRDAQGNVMAVYNLGNSKILDSSQLTIENINEQLVTTSSVQTFADFAIDKLDLQSISGFVDAYNDEIYGQGSIFDVLIGFNPVDYLLYNSTIQSDVLANYSTTTQLQSLSNYLGFLSFFGSIYTPACSDPQIIGLLVNYLGINNFLYNYDVVTGNVAALGNDYSSWLVSTYSLPPLYCGNLSDVQTLVGTYSSSYFYQFLATRINSGSYLDIQTVLQSNISSSDIIQQMAGGTNIQSIILSTFSATDLFSALRDNGPATLWGYIIAEVSPSSDIMDFYQSQDETEFLKHCIIVLPSYINGSISQTVTDYLRLVREFYTTQQYKALMSALTELYFTPSQTLKLAEWHIYGSSRVGVYNADKNLAVVVDETITEVTYETRVNVRYNGKKQYELSNHLGNVLVTISDRRTPVCVSDTTKNYNSVVLHVSDYYSFGSLLPGRKWEPTSTDKYRFGFNGKEKDDETYGEGNEMDFGARIYDGRLGRFFKTDPLECKYAWQSSYSFAANNPIRFIDILGEGPGDINVMICIDQNSANENSLTKKGDWSIIQAHSLSEAYKMMANNGLAENVDNVLLVTHGCGSNATTPDGKPVSSIRINSEIGHLTIEMLTDYLNGEPTLFQNDISALKNIMSAMSPDGNLVITACGGGNDLKFGDKLLELAGSQNINIYLNGDAGEVSKHVRTEQLQAYFEKSIIVNYEEGFKKFSKGNDGSIIHENVGNIFVSKENPWIDNIMEQKMQKATSNEKKSCDPANSNNTNNAIKPPANSKKDISNKTKNNG